MSVIAPVLWQLTDHDTCIVHAQVVIQGTEVAGIPKFEHEWEIIATLYKLVFPKKLFV